MLGIKFEKYRDKILIIVPLFILVGIFFLSSYYLTEICTSAENCTSTERNGTWQPLHAFSIYAGLILTPFLFLPIKYFKAWLLKIASWSIPIATIMVLGESPHDGGVLAIGREGMVVLSSLVIANLTLVFVLYMYAQETDKYKHIAGFWYFLLLSVSLYLSTYLVPYLM